ncbi:MAG TPA: malate/lactate/ureidoglycolate dehydrogenase [Burkholderiales bacterium]|jgi:hydroxycarboxylate dehydrogenase B|nr:malate/lactate/ureidoglycolate dehydrogenase [Burkholderiales bacterium]
MIFKERNLVAAIEAIVLAGGSEPREARLVAENLVMANLLGHDSHGIGMIPRYVDALLEGGLAANQHPKATLDAGAMLALDGCKGYGQTIGHESMQMAIERAQRHGSCIMVLANSHHLGRIGHWAEMAVAQGLVSIHFVNVISHARVAPYAGRDARFGTNPVCIGIPLPGEKPFLLDMATASVAQGKMRVAHNKREKVAPGLLIDDQGRPTDDPRYAVVPPLGAILAFGGHKGYGLAVACELLGGALTGGGTWHYDESKKQRVLNGMLTIVIDPARLGTAAAFQSETRQFVEWLRKGRPAPGADRVRLAGEPERETRAKREREGISVDDNTWKEILAAAAKVKLEPSQIEQLARG